MTLYAIDNSNKEKPFLLLESIIYHSTRYDKSIYLKKGMRSDGATWAVDVISKGWWVHDELCNTGRFSDGSKCSNWQASRILSDILKSEGYWFRSKSWLFATFLFGGGKARDNGLYKV